MKKISLLLALAIITLSCKEEAKNEYIVKGTINNVHDGTKLFIKTIDSLRQPISIDSTIIEKGQFAFKGNVSEIELAYLAVDMGKTFPFILEEGTIELNLNNDSIFNSKIGGTKNNILLNDFNTQSNVIGKKMTKFKKDNIKVWENAQKENDTATLNRLIKENFEFKTQINNLSKKFIQEHNNSFVSLLFLENLLGSQAESVGDCFTLFNSLDESLQNSAKGKNMKAVFDKVLKTEIGKEAPNFSAPSPEGKTISLKESLGKVTIIDFWASWCGPCRMENPNVVALYNEFHEKGLNIIGVSLDKDANKWKEAITKDGLTWNHISNLKHWQEPIAQMYNVTGIPATFILDEKGVIVARDLRGEELKAKVIELLK
ncbi:redoxin domain-containing protein [Flavobacterium sp.]|uniref:redoxin domain-containing protein n=1 Tax=Flavobacterium sp. TaxID=239 RepID=UPI003529AA97